ncbi:actin-related protein 10 [Anthonomus grandis grandis]|uniref:actin-related protein 10 n=1 Tax=Anthonomus grandis grandis TaxID=2921223 RepID=UPI0021660A90|nr:actin-related protein 10 [Anthonomus grandis grandis]
MSTMESEASKTAKTVQASVQALTESLSKNETINKSENLIVVLDIGTAFTKFGFESEFSPRYIIRSEVLCKKTNTVRKLCDYQSPEDLYDFMVNFIHMIYFKYALISPKGRRIIVVESLLCPTLFRETLAKVLFLQYEVSQILVLPSHLVSLASLAVDTALVVDIGYKEAVVIPVCFGLPMVHAWQALPLGGEAVHKNIRALLSSANAGVQNLPERIIEDIKVRCCFVTKKSRGEQLLLGKSELVPPPDVKYPYAGSDILTVTGKLREKAFEILYEEDNDHLCLSTMILDALLKVDRELRQTLAENLLLIGGTAMTLGFKARLKEELLKQLENDRYKTLKHIKEFKFFSSPCKENYTAWLGGSIYGATELLGMKVVTKEFYLREQHLPDWVNLRDIGPMGSLENSSGTRVP